MIIRASKVPYTTAACGTTTSPSPAQALLLFVAITGFLFGIVWELASLVISNNEMTSYGVTLVCLCASMIAVRSLYANSRLFLFSTGFWLVVTVFFYIVLKSIEIWAGGELSNTLLEILWLTTSFLLAYCIAFAWTDRSLRRKTADTVLGRVVIPIGREWFLLTIYAGFKVLGFLLIATIGDATYLDTASATQNAGASYIYNIPKVGNVILLGLLLYSFKNKRGYTATTAGVILYLSEAILSTNRLAIVMLVLWSLVLYHRYRRAIPLMFLSLISVPLILVVVILGYARNLELGSLDAYKEAVQIIMENPALITNLFMSRLDMLPQMVAGLDLFRSGQLESLNGASYIYAFLHAIPRNIWEAKPPLTSALLTAELHPGAFADGVLLFPSLIIESVLNFYYLGPMLIGLLTGFLSRQFERAFNSEQLAPSLWALSALTFPMTLFNEGVHSNFTGQLLYSTVLMMLLYKGLLILGAIKRQRIIR